MGGDYFMTTDCRIKFKHLFTAEAVFVFHEIFNLKAGYDIKLIKEHLTFCEISIPYISSVNLVVSVAGAAEMYKGTFDAVVVDQPTVVTKVDFGKCSGFFIAMYYRQEEVTRVGFAVCVIDLDIGAYTAVLYRNSMCRVDF